MFDQLTHIYFIGLGGIGMSALARWFAFNGKQVAGYDRTRTPLTQQLEDEGIALHFEDSLSSIPESFKEIASTLVVYTPAIPADHSELNYFKDHGFKVMKRSEVLGLISQQFHTIAVAGTHGKTTTSSMIAHICKSALVDFTALIGGIATNYDSNLILHNPESRKAMFVVEADEFDRSFLRLSPNTTVITAVEADHLDIYGKAEELEQSFLEFAQKVGQDDPIVVCADVPDSFKAKVNHAVTEYGISSDTTWSARNLTTKPGRFTFDIWFKGKPFLSQVELRMPGYHNTLNAIAAAAACHYVGIEASAIKSALKSYAGVKRRFEYVHEGDSTVYIDDYAHHPTEIEAFLNSVKAMYPQKKVTAVFQPHLYSRTRDFVDGFASSLQIADEVVLLDIYPARELPIEGITSQIILDRMDRGKASIKSKESITAWAATQDFEVFVTIGAGDIDQLVKPLKSIFEEKEKALSAAY